MGLVFGTAAVIALPILFATLPGGLDSLGGLATAIYLGVVPTALAYTLFGIGLRTLSASTVTTIVLAEPVVATILGVVVLDEQLTAVSLLGGGLVFVALAVLAIPGQSARAYPEPQAE